eukprot:2769233-Pyramimonas_sp.AAC.2
MAAPMKTDSFATVTIKGEGLFPNTNSVVELPAEGDLPAVTGEKGSSLDDSSVAKMMRGGAGGGAREGVGCARGGGAGRGHSV